MLIAHRSDGLMILGIDAENVRRLKAGQPILKALSRFGGTDDVLILYGETIEDVKAQIVKAGMGPLPEPEKLPESH